MPYPKVKLSDNDGNAVGVSDNRLDVNVAGATMTTGDITIDSEFPTAATIADDFANPDTTSVMSMLMGYDTSGANWNRLHTGVGNYGTGTLRVTLAANDALTVVANTSLGTIAGDTTTIAGDTTDIESYFKAPSNTYSAGGVPQGLISLAFRQDTLGDYFSGIGLIDADWSYLQVNSKGGLYVTGSEVENAAVQSEPLLIGGRYDSSARTLGSGDAGAVALNASGHVLMDVVDGGQLDTIIDTLETTLTAIETDQAAIEVLLGTIDSDTNDIKTAVEIIDNAISGNEMQVDILSIIPGTGATSLGKAEDELHAGGDVGIMALGVRKDSMGNFGDNGDYSPFQLTSDGELRVNIASSVGASEALSTGGTAKSATQRGPVMLVVRNDELAISSAGHIDGDYTHLQVDAQGALYTTHGMTGMVGGANTDIDTSAEQLDGGTDGYDVACKRVDLQASVDNTADILVGDSGVVANGSGGGVRLSPGDFYSIDIDNLTDIWVIAISANQTIIYNYFT